AHDTGHGREEIGHRLHGLDGAHRLVRLHLGAHFGQLDVDDVTELARGEIGDTDGAFFATVGADPLVIFREAYVLEIHVSSFSLRSCLAGIKRNCHAAGGHVVRADLHGQVGRFGAVAVHVCQAQALLECGAVRAARYFAHHRVAAHDGVTLARDV